MKGRGKHAAAGAAEAPREERGLSPELLADVALRRSRMILLFVAGSLALCFAWLWSTPPVYRARAKLLLDNARTSQGILGELAQLTSAPQAASEMELLRARTTAEQVVARAGKAGEPDEQGASGPLHLGLSTRVEDRSLRPLKAAWSELWSTTDVRAARGTLAAQVEPLEGGHERASLSVEFLSDERVRVGTCGLATRLGWPMGDALETDLVPGRELGFRGLRLSLEPRGALAGRSFRITRVPEAEAVERVMRATRVSETERNSGVIEIVYDDSDPVRAAATANALAATYLERNRRRGEKRASQTVDFVKSQLEAQNQALHEAELEVVALKQKEPRSVDVSKAGESLIEELSQLEVERVQIQLSRTALGEAVGLIEQGDLQAYSRLAPGLLDPISASYVEQIAKLSAEAALQERSDTGPYKALLQEHLLALESSRDCLDLERQAVAEARGALAQGGRAALGRLPESSADSDPLLSGYADSLARLEARESELAQQYQDDFPELRRLRKEEEDLTRRIGAVLQSRQEGLEHALAAQDLLRAGYVERASGQPRDERERIARAIDDIQARALAHLKSRLSGLAAHEQALRLEQRSVEAELGALPEQERIVADPLRRLAAHTEIVKFLLARQQEAEITKATSIASAEIIDPAMPPRRRHAPSIPLCLAGALLAGLSLGLLAALARESLSRGILFAAELEEATGLPVFGTIPDFRRGRMRVRQAGPRFLALRDDPHGPIGEAYRSLRANLKYALGEGDIRTIACTSSAQGEGKSVTNIDVALAFALTGKRVLLVDADMRRPSVHELLELPIEPGLAEVLAGELSWRAAVRPAVQPNLDVICAGRKPAQPGELLESEACARLVAELRAAYELVVFDVPPALAVADIETFAARLDGLLLVCRSNRAHAAVVRAATQRLQQVGANLIGAVLNAVGPASRSHLHGYGYGQAHGYGYDSADDRGRSGGRKRERAAEVEHVA